MFHLLFNREVGLHPCCRLSEFEKTRRTHSIKLSTEKNFEGTHNHNGGAINSLDLSGDSGNHHHQFLLSGGSKGTISIHQVDGTANGLCHVLAHVDREVPSGHRHSVETVSWYPHDTGLFLSSSVDGTLKAWDTNTLECVESFSFSDMVYNHQMSQVAVKHSLVAVACKDSRVYLADLQSGSTSHILRGHRRDVLSLAWSARDPFLLASGSRDNKVLLWDIRKASGLLCSLDQYNGKQSSDSSTSKTAHNGHVNALHFTANGLHLLSYGTDERLRLWDVMTGKNTLLNYGRISNHYMKGVQIAVTPTSRELAFLPSASHILAVEIHTGKHVMELKGHYQNVNCCTFEDNFQELYSGSNDTYILAWQPEMGRKVDFDSTISHDEGGRDLRTKYGPVGYQDSWSSDEDS